LLARLKRRKSLIPAEDGPSPPITPAAPEVPSTDLSDRVRESLDLLEADLRELIGKVGRAAEQVHTGIGTSTQTLDTVRISTSDLSNLAETASTNVSMLAGATEQIAQSTSHIGEQVHFANPHRQRKNFRTGSIRRSAQYARKTRKLSRSRSAPETKWPR
jgi:methyl-accepting chemotaxis protein